MTKKYYMKPAVEVSQAEAEQIVAESLTGIQTDGLDENENLDYDDTGANPWEDAW